MTIIEAIILGMIQGLTEFLPVSSSGHLVLFQSLLGLNEPGVTLEVLLHFGTLLSVFWVFGRDFLDLLKFNRNKDERRFLLMLVVGVVVTAVMGIILKPYVEGLFSSNLPVGIMLIVTGLILFIITRIKIGKKEKGDIKIADALTVGLLQGFAVIPGISRSGSTIMASLWKGLNRETAVKYSFMLSAPVILGVTVLEVKDLAETGLNGFPVIPYLAGMMVAFLSGVAAIKIFIRLLEKAKFHYFAYYCWLVGAIVIISSLRG